MDRFWRKVDKSGDCWVWTAAVDSSGYGSFHLDGGMRLAHRVSYAIAGGTSHLELDHTCGNRLCVHPEHLEPVSREENMRRAGLLRSGVRCLRGHDMVSLGTYQRGGVDYCRECRRKAARRCYAKKKQNRSETD